MGGVIKAVARHRPCVSFAPLPAEPPVGVVASSPPPSPSSSSVAPPPSSLVHPRVLAVRLLLPLIVGVAADGRGRRHGGRVAQQAVFWAPQRGVGVGRMMQQLLLLLVVVALVAAGGAAVDGRLGEEVVAQGRARRAAALEGRHGDGDVLHDGV